MQVLIQVLGLLEGCLTAEIYAKSSSGIPTRPVYRSELGEMWICDQKALVMSFLHRGTNITVMDVKVLCLEGKKETCIVEWENSHSEVIFNDLCPEEVKQMYCYRR